MSCRADREQFLTASCGDDAWFKKHVVSLLQADEESGDSFATRSVLGGCLLRQKKYPEAELSLLAAYQGMQEHESQIAAAAAGGDFKYLAAVPRVPVMKAHPRLRAVQLAVQVRKQEAGARLVALYEVTNRVIEAADWKQKLSEPQTNESEN